PQAPEIAHGSVLRSLHLRIPDPAAAGHRWAHVAKSVRVLRRCDDSDPSAGRSKLVFGRKSRKVSQTSSQAKGPGPPKGNGANGHCPAHGGSKFRASPGIPGHSLVTADTMAPTALGGR